MNPVRTCIGCRTRTDKSSLLRVVARNGVVTPDPSEALPGRGAWVHPTPECIDKSISRKAFGRALRITGVLDAGLLSTSTSTSTSTTSNTVTATQSGLRPKSPKEQAD